MQWKEMSKLMLTNKDKTISAYIPEIVPQRQGQVLLCPHTFLTSAVDDAV